MPAKISSKQKNKIAELNSSYKEKYGFEDKIDYTVDFGKGINIDTVTAISKFKKEDAWMLDFRQKAFAEFEKKPMPGWGPDLSEIDFDNFHYFVKAGGGKKHTWEEVPEKIKTTFNKLGIPQTERKFLAGVATQYESEVVYQKLKEKWDKLGIIFLDTDSAYQQYPEIFKEYFGKIVPPGDNKFSALNSAVWSGGSFIYIPKNVKVSIPLQTYFRINLKNIGQFERTLIIADEGSEIHYIEGCTAPIYSTDSLHAAVVEVVVKKNAKVRYTTLQNWSTNVYNLVTKRALVHENGIMEWVDCNLGSKITMKYPSVYLTGDNSHGEILSLALAGKGQIIDAGTKAIHKGKNTTSNIISKSISLNGGRSSFRSLINHAKGAKNSKSNVVCNALILDKISRTDTYPTNIEQEQQSFITHEATVSKLNSQQLNYLASRGLSEESASAMIINGFIEPVAKELPMEYSMELNALINMNMEGSVS
jgi:Fe-S cluster assembly protein SufB